MKAMIFAAGLGTRLKPLTDRMPKALVPVGGRPLLQLVLQKLASAGVVDAVINVHHFADHIIAFLKYNETFGVRVRISDEREQLLETGGGLKKAAPLLTAEDQDPVLIHNVDILSNVDLHLFYEKHKNFDAALLVSERQTNRYLLFDNNNRLVGWTNLQTGEVKSPYDGLDVSACRMYAFSGIHLFSPRLFPLMDSWPEKFSIIDFYLSVCDRTDIRGYCDPGLRLLDVGKIDSIQAAEEFLHTL